MTGVNKQTKKVGKALNDRPISFRASHALEQRIAAAARALRLERSELMRQAMVRFLSELPGILKKRAESSGHSKLIPVSGPLFADVPPSPEEMFDWIRGESEYGFTLAELEKRIAKLEEASEKK